MSWASEQFRPWISGVARRAKNEVVKVSIWWGEEKKVVLVPKGGYHHKALLLCLAPDQLLNNRLWSNAKNFLVPFIDLADNETYYGITMGDTPSRVEVGK